LSRQATVTILLVLGFFFAIPMLGRKSDDRQSERVDVNGDGNDTETGNSYEVCYEGDPYDVVYFANVKMYNIGTIEGSTFNPLMGNNGLRYAYEDKQKAIAKATQLNNPKGGGVLAPEHPDDTPSDGSNGLPPTELPPTLGGYSAGLGSGGVGASANEQVGGWNF